MFPGWYFSTDVSTLWNYSWSNMKIFIWSLSKNFTKTNLTYIHQDLKLIFCFAFRLESEIIYMNVITIKVPLEKMIWFVEDISTDLWSYSFIIHQHEKKILLKLPTIWRMKLKKIFSVLFLLVEYYFIK
jgi:hypothetical protein